MFKAVAILTMSFFALSVQATEVDSWTFSDIELQEAAPEINAFLNGAVNEILAEIDADQSDAEIEVNFFKKWGDKYVDDSSYYSTFSTYGIGYMEKCILERDCGLENIERIIHKSSENVYQSYNYVAANFSAPVIQLCGVRMGADKLTHFFEDGLRYYEAYMRGDSMEKIQQDGMAAERHLMGGDFTGVVSWADAEANIDGVRFYRSFFEQRNSLVARRIKIYRSAMDSVNRYERSLELLRPLDICEYVEEDWSERVLENEFAQDVTELDSAIQRRILDSNPWNLSREEVLNREYQPPGLMDNILSMGSLISGLKSYQGKVQLIYHVMADHDSQLENRREVNLWSIIE